MSIIVFPRSGPFTLTIYTRYKNKVVYDIADQRSYYRAVIDYIAGMTDEFVTELFSELTRFR